MLAKNGRMKIALQRSGRLTEESVTLLRACGLNFEFLIASAMPGSKFPPQ